MHYLLEQHPHLVMNNGVPVNHLVSGQFFEPVRRLVELGTYTSWRQRRPSNTGEEGRAEHDEGRGN